MEKKKVKQTNQTVSPITKLVDESIVVDELESNSDTTSERTVSGNILAKHNGQYTHWTIGGHGGNSFSDTYYRDGVAITRIETWADTWTLRGIRLTFSNSKVIMRGSTAGKNCGSLNLDYSSGEIVTELSVWGNGEGTRCGAFRIRTSKGQDYFPKMTKWPLRTEYKMNAGGGVILGIIGGGGSDIDRLGFLVLNKVNASVLTNFEYSFSELHLPEKKTAYDQTIPNPSDKDSDNGFVSLKVNKEKSGEWFVKAGLKFGTEFKVSAGIPTVVEGSVTSHWEISAESGYTSSWSESEEVTVQVPLIIPALTKTRIVYFFFQGKVDSCPFKATMKYYIAGGGIWSCSVSGFYNGVDTTRGIGTSYLIAKWDKNTGQWIEAKSTESKLLDIKLS